MSGLKPLLRVAAVLVAAIAAPEDRPRAFPFFEPVNPPARSR